jgi:hypothetical protein
VLIENSYGRLKVTFGIISDRAYAGDLSRLIKMIRICLSLTNFLIRRSPLREEHRQVMVQHVMDADDDFGQDEYVEEEDSDEEPEGFPWLE